MQRTTGAYRHRLEHFNEFPTLLYTGLRSSVLCFRILSLHAGTSCALPSDFCWAATTRRECKLGSPKKESKIPNATQTLPRRENLVRILCRLPAIAQPGQVGWRTRHRMWPRALLQIG